MRPQQPPAPWPPTSLCSPPWPTCTTSYAIHAPMLWPNTAYGSPSLPRGNRRTGRPCLAQAWTRCRCTKSTLCYFVSCAVRRIEGASCMLPSQSAQGHWTRLDVGTGGPWASVLPPAAAYVNPACPMLCVRPPYRLEHYMDRPASSTGLQVHVRPPLPVTSLSAALTSLHAVRPRLRSGLPAPAGRGRRAP